MGVDLLCSCHCFVFHFCLVGDILMGVVLQYMRTSVVLVGLPAVSPGSPVVMTAAQCLLLARSAARAERTETLKETKTLAKRKCNFRDNVLFLRVLLCCSLVAPTVCRSAVSVFYCVSAFTARFRMVCSFDESLMDILF